MVTIYRKEGMVFRMYFKASEHNPPHIHICYGGYGAAFNILNGRIIEEYAPRKIKRKVSKIIMEYNKELKTMWETQEIKPIDKGEL